mmetsp:Transcript_6086/g.12186  ORF Transcript_6086/g.12186 Transcript_6086/m.12186 type:complete len:273 (+) Transcript_6086:373-1191(+)
MVLRHDFNSFSHHLVNDSLCRLHIFDCTGNLAHQKGHDIHLVFEGDFLARLFKLFYSDLVWELPLRAESLDILLAVVLPIHDELSFLDAQGPTSVDQCADGVVVASTDNSFLVTGRGTSLSGGDKSRANPNSFGAQCQGHGQASSIVDATCGHHVDRLTSHGRLVSLAEVHSGRNQDARAYFPSVTASFTALCADEVNAHCKALLDMLRGTDHVHHEDSVSVALFDHPFRRNTNGTHKELCARLYDNVHQLGELTLGVVVVGSSGTSTHLGE